MGRIERFLEAVPNDRTNPQRVLLTFLFADLVGSTERAAELGDRRWTELVESHRAQTGELLVAFGGREVDRAGDGLFATFDTATSAICCGSEIARSAEPLGLEVRVGVHTGECERVGDRVRGIAVHTAARLLGLARPGEVLVTRTVRDVAAGSGIPFEDRGEHPLKGVPGSWRLYGVPAFAAEAQLA